MNALARTLVLAAALAAGAAHADEPAPKPVKPANRAEAIAVVAQARRIVTPNGIERSEKVRIGGIEQWVSIRGNDRRNPVLLVVHGGPGYVSMPMSWWNGRGWEEYFTVVHWDQRASGKTHLLTPQEQIAPTLTPERMIADVEEMVAWVRKDLGKDKIFLLGHSYGSYLGLETARRHPQWLHAYIGVGQATDVAESERRGWRATLDAAQRDGNAEAVRELEALAPYAAPGHPPTIQQIYAQRKWLQRYGGTMAYRQNNDDDSVLARLSPDYSDEQLRGLWKGNDFATPILLPQLMTQNLATGKTLDCPLILLLGRHDTNVNSDVAAEWYAQVKAPGKALVWFEHSAHMPMTEEPGKFLLALVNQARPYAQKVGDAAP
ncbi:alpha/beta fold hydrolase [Lysobacter enzymogenes]|uniref:Alpha/beta fold family hydrolase n=1 Tax=Lysobacter enzymogenes TaxID=69 RepID=A0AAU9AE71_LYSEN|nr:alpha/beta fold hydrolase [Lysobacter enzymogenes]BAV96223.1 alpha/beta fold family hydrolase [Lysobacter enzymogenes]